MLITILEDDSTLQYALSKYLRNVNYEIRVFNNLNDALSHEILDGIYLVDVNLQDGLGFDYGKKIIKNKNAYLIYLTVRKGQSDILEGFNTGADDYITKPFSFEELEQRINALLRRNSERYLKLGNLLVDTDLASVTIKDEEIFLSVQEYRILYLLMRQKGNPVSRENLNSSLNIMEETQEGTLNVAITRLRKKLGDNLKIEAVYKQGYRISL